MNEEFKAEFDRHFKEDGIVRVERGNGNRLIARGAAADFLRAHGVEVYRSTDTVVRESLAAALGIAMEDYQTFLDEYPIRPTFVPDRYFSKTDPISVTLANHPGRYWRDKTGAVVKREPNPFARS